MGSAQSQPRTLSPEPYVSPEERAQAQAEMRAKQQAALDKRLKNQQRKQSPSPSGAQRTSNSAKKLSALEQCNEIRPRCGNCVRLDSHCNWPSIQNQYSTSSPLSNGSSNLSPSNVEQGYPHSAGKLDTDLPILDLRLLHHWTSKCYHSLRPNEAALERADFWRDECTEVALHNPPLLHSYLAIAAVHRALTVPGSDRQSLILQAESHMSCALSIYRKQLEVPVVERAIPVFMTSTSLFMYHLGFTQLEKPEDPMEGIYNSFRLLAGVKVVVMVFWKDIKDSRLFTYLVTLADGDDDASLDARGKSDSTPEILGLKELAGSLLDVRDREACLAEIEQLHQTSVRIRHLSTRSDEYSLVLSWASRLHERFMHLVLNRNPVACIVVTYFAALLAQARPVWWVGKWPQWLLIACEQLLTTTPELLKWLEWPRRIINTKSVVSTPVPFDHTTSGPCS
ncbi:hypothetical protein OPT61_g1308 [Boeremia exigua]|uniref:Uncharacterized protein n=1 Tax=Boeremia exigua TaxID=749465 RepID=A0ACC2IQW4_9PLEO|nr:hypothetical protein OPT61_g1308 [Boeremia exigua]